MAKTNPCSACGGAVSKNAKACPHCGEPAKKASCLPGCLVVILGFGVFLAIGIANSGNNAGRRPAEKKTPTDESTVALWQMQEFVKQRLKSPATAEFPGGLFDSKQGHVRHLGDQVYLVTSHVDSQNSFGATIRTKYVGRIQQTKPNNWKLLDLEFVE